MSSLRLRRVGRWCFEMWILKKLLDILNSFIIKCYSLLDKLNSFSNKCNRLLGKCEEKQKEEYKNRLDILKIIDNKDYIIKNASTKRWKFLGYSFISAVIGCVIIFCKVIPPQFCLALLFIFIMSLFLFNAYNFFILFGFSFGKLLRYITLSISMSINAFIIGDLVINAFSNANVPNRIVKFIKYSFVEFNLNNVFDGKVYQFWSIIIVLSLASCFSLFFVLQSQNIFELEDMKSENRFILGLLAILTFIIGVDLDKVRPISIALLILVIQTAIFEFYYPHLISKNHKKAQNIFQEQLLLEKPRYKELKKCYYHGGEKYKEKLLSTEKFLRLIKKREKYLIRRDKNNRYSYKSGFNPQNNISPTRNCLS